MTDTTTHPATPDAAALAAWMADAVPGFRGPLVIERFEGGQSNPTFKLTGPAGRFVLRRKPPGKLLPSAHAIDREYRVMKALGATDVPVPRVLALCEDDAVIGSAFYVMDMVDGRIFWDPRLPDLAPATRGAMFDSMNDTIARLHRVDPAAVGLGDYGRAGGYVGRQIARWTQQYRASETERIEAMENLIAWLPGKVPAGDETAIVHGDFRMDNLIFHPTEPRVVAILDWELSTLGHPLADFSYHLMTWRFPPELFRGLAGVDLAALGIPGETAYAEAYARRTGRGAIAHLDVYLAYNIFRMAAILQGVMARALAGNAASAAGVEMGAKVRPMAEIAWAIAQRVDRGS